MIGWRRRWETGTPWPIWPPRSSWSTTGGCRKLVIAAAWADAHSEVDHPDGGLLVERLVSIGPAWMPPVAEFAPQGLVGPFDTTSAVREGVDG